MNSFYLLNPFYIIQYFYFNNIRKEFANFSKSLKSLFIFVNFCFINIYAQPSGGPYGPVQLNYELPKVSGKIYYVAPNGKKDGSGNDISSPISIESAVEKVQTGDAIILRGGIYRIGNLVFNQGITVQPYKNESPIFKGTLVAKDWENLGNGLWITHWDHLFPSKPDDWWRRNREGKITPLHKFNNDMVFIDGRFLQSAGWEGEVDEKSYYIDYETGTVYIGVNPTNKLVEITAFNSAFIRTIGKVHKKNSDHKGPTIRGIKFTQYAYRAIEIEGKDPVGLSPESEHGKDVIGTTIENCTISYCSRVAAYLRGDSLTIRNCLISDTSTEGLYILSSADVLLENNIFRRNNIERITGYYPAAVKIFNQTYRVTCQNNLVTDLPYSNGIWYDVGNVDGRFINNYIENVGFTNEKMRVDQVWPSQNGFFFEISKGAIVAGNVFVNCDHGMMILNSSNVHVFQNTFFNSTAVIGRNERSSKGDHFGWHPSTGPDVDQRIGHIFVNNLLTSDENFKRPLLFVWQSSTICKKVIQQPLKEIDYNTYVRRTNNTDVPIIIWSPAKTENCQQAFYSPNDLNVMFPKFSVHSKFFSNYNGPLFKSIELKNFEILKSFPGFENAMKIPSELNKWFNKNIHYVGAYKPIK